jgi:CheY-like chemotaxis protein/anti-sigma regulatory factor (Ser/Thr protein kinase)
LHESVAASNGLVFSNTNEVDPTVFDLGDAGRVKQVIHNLLSNAVKFTERGSVDIVARVEQGGAGQELVVVVRDTGIGIPTDFVPQLGTSFARADNGVAMGGAGLGLCLSRVFAARMGGSLDYEANPAGGSVFKFRKPLRLVDTQADEEPGACIETRIAPLKVLVAEDNAINREIIALLLEPFDTELTFAVDGVEALEAAKSHQFELVLMDLKMPRMDGLEATRQLRAWERQISARRTPIICLSASSPETVLQSVLDAGADAFLGKPINVAELIGAIRDVVAAETPFATN